MLRNAVDTALVELTAPSQGTDERRRSLAAERERLDAELANFAAAVAVGGDVPTL